jgi:signal transduction histidine kinase
VTDLVRVMTAELARRSGGAQTLDGPVPPVRVTVHPRWRPFLMAAPYALLGALTVVSVVVHRSQGPGLLLDLGLSALMAAWLLGMFTLRRPEWRDQPQVRLALSVGLILLNAAMVLREPWFGVFTPVGYVFAFRLRWPAQIAAVAGMAVVAGAAQGSPIDLHTALGVLAFLAVIAANMVPMCVFCWLLRRADQQDAERDRTLAELAEANRRLAASLAENAALHDQLLERAREAGMLDERQRIAREIHDTLAQGLTGIITQLQAAEQAGTAGWRRHFELATGLARESLSEARRSVHALRPRQLESAPLGEALTAVATRWTAVHGLAVEVTTTGTVRPVPPDTETALLRTAQEALANVAKHAGASRVGVTLSYLEHEVALDVRDDGRGFDPDQLAGRAGRPSRADGSGFGLEAMRQRIEALSGSLQVESEPGGGTAISACVPTGRTA